MAKKDSLFILIKSLTKSEKRHFRLQAKANGDNAKYLQLFDLIDKQRVPDEGSIRRYFREADSARQLHVLKIYLANLILKSLRNYHANNSVHSKILDLLRDVEILFSKELYDQCFYKLEKAKKLGKEYEKETLLLELLSWERRLMIAQQKTSDSVTKEISKQEKQSLLKLSNLNSYWDRTFSVLTSYKDTGFLKSMDTKQPLSLQATTLHRHVLYSCHFMKGDLAKAEKEITYLISYMEQQPGRIAEDPGPYVTAIGNKIGLLIRQKRWNETEELIKTMRNVPATYSLSNENKFTLKLWLRIFNLELEIYRDTRQLTKATALITEVEEYISQHSAVIPDSYRIMLYYQIANIYFLKGEFSNCLHWINLILNGSFGETRIDLQCSARILNLIAHFELDNIIVLRYSVDSARRFLKKKKADGSEEQSILRLFSKLSVSHPENYKSIFEKFQQEQYESGSARIEEMQDYIDLRSWISDKIIKNGHRQRGRAEAMR